jgi:protein-tyrosine phosphatase
MHKVPDYLLWLGNEGDVQDMRKVFASGIEALVDLAASAPSPQLPRETLYCRIPLVDGPENPPWTVQLAIETVVRLIRAKVPTLVYCGGGMSRSPCIAAASLALLKGCSLPEALTHLSQFEAMDINPGLLAEVQNLIASAPLPHKQKG